MRLHDTITHQLDLYTGVSCWRGEFNDASRRRLTDVFNDSSHSYIVLERASLILWDGRSPQEGGALGAISVSKKNAVAIVCNSQAPAAPGNRPERVRKVPRRALLFAPPLAIIGNLHGPADASLLAIIEFAQQDFLPLTSAQLWRLDTKEPLSPSRELILVNRQAIAAVRPAPSDETPLQNEPTATATSVAPNAR